MPTDELRQRDPAFANWVDGMPEHKRVDWITEMLVLISGGQPQPGIDLEQWLKEWEHRPGWKFRLQFLGGTTFALVIEFETVDAKRWREEGVVERKIQTFRYGISGHPFARCPAVEARKLFDHLVQDAVMRTEQHEVYEFLRRRGQQIRNPHKEQ